VLSETKYRRPVSNHLHARKSFETRLRIRSAAPQDELDMVGRIWGTFWRLRASGAWQGRL